MILPLFIDAYNLNEVVWYANTESKSVVLLANLGVWPQSSKYNVTFLGAARDRRTIDLFTPSYQLAIGNKPSLLVIILTVDGELAAVLVPIRDADIETVSLSLNPNFIGMLQESRARLKTEGGISLEQLKQELSELLWPELGAIALIEKSAIAQIESTQNNRKITVYNRLATELVERPNADKRLLSPLKSNTTSNLTWGIVCRRNWKCPSASERLRKRATIIHCWVGNRRAIAQQCKRSL